MSYVPSSIKQLMNSPEYRNSWDPKHSVVSQAIANYFKSVYPDNSDAEPIDEDKEQIARDIISAMNKAIAELEDENKRPDEGDDEEDDDDEDDYDPNEETFWVWDAGGGCDSCEGMDGAIVDCPNDVGCAHPNCQCSASQMSEADFNKKYGGEKKSLQDKLKKVREERTAYEAKYGPESLGRNPERNTPDANGNQRLDLRNPASGGYGAPRDGGARKHEGVDINMKPGDTVHAYSSGMVAGIGSSSDIGNVKNDIVTISHNDGTVGRYFYTDSNVGIGDKIEKGQPIGTLHDMSSRYGPSTPSHLHFESRTNQDKGSQQSRSGQNWGASIDPLKYLKGQGHCEE